MTETEPTKKWKLIWPILKWGLCLLVVVFVAMRASDLWQKDELRDVHFHFGWLLLAMGVYIVSWIPSARYWQLLLHAMGQQAIFSHTIQAYYCGHLGKYIPGKAVVLVIRAGMLKSRGHAASAAAVTATFETLLMMGVGLAVGLALFPVTNWPPQIAGWVSPAWVVPLVITVSVIAALPVISMLLTRISKVMTPKNIHQGSKGDHQIRIPMKLVAYGMAMFLLSWALLGLSLGLTIQAVSNEPFDISNWPIWTGAVSLATAIGFAAIFAPGGMGVREGLLIEILQIQPNISERQAVVVSVLLRLVWLAAEILTAAALYWMYRRTKNGFGENAPMTETEKAD